MNSFDINTGGKIFLTSDTHFGHKNIIKYCDRPFGDAAEMDQELIRRWNSVVGPEDTVVHLGDFAFKSGLAVDNLLEQLNGIKYLVMGNHDKPKELKKTIGFTDVSYDYVAGAIVIPATCELRINGKLIAMLSHYPLPDWPGRSSFVPLFFGHIHTAANKRVVPALVSYDVGVDNNNYQPILLETALGKVSYA